MDYIVEDINKDRLMVIDILRRKLKLPHLLVEAL